MADPAEVVAALRARLRAPRAAAQARRAGRPRHAWRRCRWCGSRTCRPGRRTSRSSSGSRCARPRRSGSRTRRSSFAPARPIGRGPGVRRRPGAPRHRRGVRAGLRRGRRHAGVVDLSHVRPGAVRLRDHGGATCRRLAAHSRRARRRHDRDLPRRGTWSSSGTAAATATATWATSCTRRRCTTRTGSADAASPASLAGGAPAVGADSATRGPASRRASACAPKRWTPGGRLADRSAPGRRAPCAPAFRPWACALVVRRGVGRMAMRRSHQPLDPAVLQRARRARGAGPGRGGAVLAVTAFNLWQVYVLSGRQAELQGAHHAGRVEDARASGTRRRGSAASINPRDLEATVAAAREANALIERRVFSWTRAPQPVRDDAARRACASRRCARGSSGTAR